MGFLAWLATYGAALAAFVVVDLTWLGIVANNLYRDKMGSLLRESPNLPVAALFYLAFLVGLLYFAIQPAVDGGGWPVALRNGALFGFFTYATYDLTNLAVLKGYPPSIAVIDLIWGTVLCTIVAAAAYACARAVS